MGSLLCNVCLVTDNITNVLPIRINILCNMHQNLKYRAPSWSLFSTTVDCLLDVCTVVSFA